MKNINLFNGAAKDPKTGRFCNPAALKPVHAKAASKPKAEKPKAEKPKAEKKAKVEHIVNIISALYGIGDTRIEIKENVKIGKKLNNKMAGSDPAPKQKKDLLVTAEINGEKVEKTFAEGEVLAF